VCKVVFKLQLASGVIHFFNQFNSIIPKIQQTMGGIWNADGSPSQYTTASWMNIQPGATSKDIGFTVNGGGTPSASVVSATAC
jgi:hypothetical protein